MAYTSAFHELLDKQKGVVFADDYTDPAILDYLSSQMKTLADAGVRTLFVPMFRNTSQHRKWLDNMSTGIATGEERNAMQAHLAREWCTTIKGRTPEDYMKLLDSARKTGIRVIGMETTETNSIKPVSHSNAAWNAAVLSHQMLYPEGKFAVLGGKYHTDSANRFCTDEAVEVTQGIDRMLNVPCVEFSHANTTSRTRISPKDIDGLYTVFLSPKTKAHENISR